MMSENSITDLKKEPFSSFLNDDCFASLWRTIKSLRPAEPEDLPVISQMMKMEERSLFGDCDPYDLYKNSSVNAVITNFIDEPILFVSLRNYPNIPALHPSAWQDYIAQHYEIDTLTPTNCLFFHMITTNYRYNWDMIIPLLQFIFLENAILQYLVFLQPPVYSELLEDGIFEKYFTKILPKLKEVNPDDSVTATSMLICHRHNIIPKLHVRSALVSDNDDLVNLLDPYCPELKSTYGEYFISEIILKSKDTRQIIIAEYDCKIAGMMCLNRALSQDSLGKYFDINSIFPSSGISDPKSSTAIQEYNSSDTTDIAIKDDEYIKNTIAIELFAMSNDCDDRMAFDMLEASFGVFKDNYEFIILMQDPSASYFPLLHYMNVNIPKMMTIPPQSLFSCCCSSILDRYSCKVAKIEDLPEIKFFLSNVETHGNTLTQIYSVFDDKSDASKSQIILTYCGSILVNLIKISPCLKMNEYKTWYNITQYLNFEERIYEIALINLIITASNHRSMYPIFMTELSRLTGYNEYFYELTADDSKDYRICSILDTFRTVSVKSRPVLLCKTLKNKTVAASEVPTYPLYYSNTSLFHCRKCINNTRILIIGCGISTLAFLETLIFSPEYQNIYFTNVVVFTGVNPIQDDFDTTDSTNMFPIELKYTKQYCTALGLNTWITFVHGKVTRINVVKKTIQIDKKKIAYNYDNLVFLGGLQFDKPQTLRTKSEPSNLFYLNNHMDVMQMLKTYKLFSAYLVKHSIIIYGNTIETILAVSFLLSTGCNPNLIGLVRPPWTEENDQRIFNDFFVAETVEFLIGKSGIYVYDDYTLSHVQQTPNGFIKNVYFKKEEKPCSFTCHLFFCLYKKEVSWNNVTVLNQADIVFNGRVVINDSFETNHEDIFAGGSCTRYQQIYYEPDNVQEFNSSEEVGTLLAHKVIKKIMPNVTSMNFEKPKPENTIPRFKEPLYTYCKLLNGFNYLYVRKAGPNKSDLIDADKGFTISTRVKQASSNSGISLKRKKLPRSKVSSQSDASDKFISLTDVLSTDYFKIHLDEYNIVDEVVCFSRKDYPAHFYLKLYGKHEKFLNSLMSKYQRNEIKDLFSFFSLPWLSVTLSEEFVELQKVNRMLANLRDYCNKEPVVTEMALRTYEEMLANQLITIDDEKWFEDYVLQLKSNLLDFFCENEELFKDYMNKAGLEEITNKYLAQLRSKAISNGKLK